MAFSVNQIVHWHWNLPATSGHLWRRDTFVSVCSSQVLLHTCVFTPFPACYLSVCVYPVPGMLICLCVFTPFPACYLSVHVYPVPGMLSVCVCLPRSRHVYLYTCVYPVPGMFICTHVCLPCSRYVDMSNVCVFTPFPACWSVHMCVYPVPGMFLCTCVFILFPAVPGIVRGMSHAGDRQTKSTEWSHVQLRRRVRFQRWWGFDWLQWHGS